MICISLIIPFCSKGPVLYKARRVGINGELFTLYKFRTMIINSGPIKITTLTNDSRVYKFGRFLRYTKLDELPQLINILFGKMSFVGPRPEDEENADIIYKDKYKKLIEIKPGLTSLGSLLDYIEGENIEDESIYVKDFLHRKLDLELYYVNNRNFRLDIIILFKTFIVIILKFFGLKKIHCIIDKYITNNK